MSHTLSLSDDQYDMLAQIAHAAGKTPEDMLDALLLEAWERLCARYDEAFERDPDWQASIREGANRGDAPRGRVFYSLDEFIEALDEGQEGHETTEQAQSLDGQQNTAR